MARGGVRGGQEQRESDMDVCDGWRSFGLKYDLRMVEDVLGACMLMQR